MKNRKSWGIIAKDRQVPLLCDQKMELHALHYVPPPCPVSPSECSTIPLGMFCVAELMAPSVPCFILPVAALFLQWSQRWGGREFSNTSTIRGLSCTWKETERQRCETKPPQNIWSLQPEIFTAVLALSWHWRLPLASSVLMYNLHKYLCHCMEEQLDLNTSEAWRCPLYCYSSVRYTSYFCLNILILACSAGTSLMEKPLQRGYHRGSLFCGEPLCADVVKLYPRTEHFWPCHTVTWRSFRSASDSET